MAAHAQALRWHTIKADGRRGGTDQAPRQSGLSLLLREARSERRTRFLKMPRAMSLLVWSAGSEEQEDKPMKITRQGFLLRSSPAPSFSAYLRHRPPGFAAAVVSPNLRDPIEPDRTAADRTNDLRRKPEQMLEFIGIRPGIVALDLSAAGGYTTELLARSIGPTGKVHGQVGPAIRIKRRHPPLYRRAIAAQISRRLRPRRRRRPHHGHLWSHWLIATPGSTRPASRLRRSSLSPGPLRIPFLRNWRRNRSIW